MIQPQDTTAPEVELVGEMRPELEKLSGAKVRIAGVRAESGRLTVSHYQILEVAGHVPVVGIVRVQDANVTVTTDSGETLSVQGAAELLAFDGAKVWVILDAKGALTGYGILRKR